MTATAQGRVMTCDQAGCAAPATVEHDAWLFCVEHGKVSKDLAAQVQRPRPTAVPSPKPSGAVAVAPTAEPVMSPLGLLLEQAGVHSSGKVRRLAVRIENDLDALRGLIAAQAQDEKRRQAEKAAREQAAAEVARLEQQLAAAKAKLRVNAASPTGRKQPERPLLPCPRGCGKHVRGNQGLALHAKSCTA